VDWISTIIVALLAGLILGPLARLLVPGKQNIGILMTVLVGAGAALVGGIIATALGVGETSGIDWIKHLIQVVLAVLGVMAVASMGTRSGEPDRPAS
jgi:uncharacterized membrane protein YeaQ/YmgE (transglycosylase-associated protein family)